MYWGIVEKHSVYILQILLITKKVEQSNTHAQVREKN